MVASVVLPSLSVERGGERPRGAVPSGVTYLT